MNGVGFVLKDKDQVPEQRLFRDSKVALAKLGSMLYKEVD